MGASPIHFPFPLPTANGCRAAPPPVPTRPPSTPHPARSTNMPEEKIHQALEGAKKHGIENIVALRGGEWWSCPRWWWPWPWPRCPAAVVCAPFPAALAFPLLPCSHLWPHRPALVACCCRVLLPGGADPPKGAETWTATAGGFTCALDLIKFIRATYGGDFNISTAGYPEGHPNVIKKVEPGAAAALSEAEKKRVITLEDGDWVCYDAVRSSGSIMLPALRAAFRSRGARCSRRPLCFLTICRCCC